MQIPRPPPHTHQEEEVDLMLTTSARPHDEASQEAPRERVSLPMPETQESLPWVGKIPWRRKGSPLQYSCLENAKDRGTWRAAVHGVVKSQIRLSD